MFEALAFVDEPQATITSSLVSRFGKVAVQDFVARLRDANLIYTASQSADGVDEVLSSTEYRTRRADALRAKRVIFFGSERYYALLSCFDWMNDVTFIEHTPTITEEFLLGQLETDTDLVIVDASSYSPRTLSLLNDVAIARDVPWMLYQGAYGPVGQIGPIFAGSTTGCFHCLTSRHRSTTLQVGAFDRHRTWLLQEGRMSSPSRAGSPTTDLLLLSIAIADAERFLVDDDLAETFGVMLEVDLRSYAITPHRLLPVPLCNACHPGLEYRYSPWLDALTLNRDLA